MSESSNLLRNSDTPETIKINTVYVFGAGASANAIPIMKNLRDRIVKVSELIGEFHHTIKSGIVSGSNILSVNKETLEEIYEDFKWLIEESKYFDSLDTLAKKYYLLGNSEGYFSLLRLKRILCIYFYFEQWYEIQDSESHAENYKTIDLRYDSLIAALLENKEGEVKFKEGVKFISWNYDLQFEKTLLKYSNTNNFNSLKKEYFIIPNKSTLNNNDTVLTYENVASLIKLNGNAFLDQNLNEKDNTTTLYDIKSEFQNFGNLLEHLLSYYTKIFSSNNGIHESLKYFNYSWEVNEKEKYAYQTINRTIQEAKKSLSTAKTLIIVGYSFPYVNKEVDKEILSDCFPNKIIIQDLQPEIILRRLKSILNYKINQRVTSKKIEVILEEVSNYFPTPD